MSLLACPDADDTVLAALDHISVPDAHALNDGGGLGLLSLSNTGAAVPMTSLDLVIHLNHVLTSGADNPAGVEHHAGNRVIVCVGVKD